MPRSHVFGPHIVCNGEQIVSLKSVADLHQWAQEYGVDISHFHSTSRYPHYDLPEQMRHRPITGGAMVSKFELVNILVDEGLISESVAFGNNICLSDNKGGTKWD